MSLVVASDDEIARLVAMEKRLPPDWRTKLQPKKGPKVGHGRRSLEVRGSDGTQFRVDVRQSDFSPFNFSAILMYLPPRSGVWFRLRRYNGRSHEHTNKLERTKFYDYHVHMATERYQARGFDPDGYAEPTDRYTLLDQALLALLADCGFTTSGAASDDQLSLEFS